MPKYRHSYKSYSYSIILSIKNQYLFSIFLKKFLSDNNGHFGRFFTSTLFNLPKLVVHLAIILFFRLTIYFRAYKIRVISDTPPIVKDWMYHSRILKVRKDT